VAEKRVPDEPIQFQPTTTSPATTSTPTPPSIQVPFQEIQHRAAWKAGVLGSLNVLALVLGIRFIVLVAVVGGISLTWLALKQPDPYQLIALGTYCVAVVVPCVWLAARGH
jgi:hypothetical protein